MKQVRGYRITFYVEDTPVWVEEVPHFPGRDRLVRRLASLENEGYEHITEIHIKGLD